MLEYEKRKKWLKDQHNRIYYNYLKIYFYNIHYKLVNSLFKIIHL